MNARNGDRQVKSPRSGTARIDKADSIPLGVSELMGVSTDHKWKSRRRVEIELL